MIELLIQETDIIDESPTEKLKVKYLKNTDTGEVMVSPNKRSFGKYKIKGDYLYEKSEVYDRIPFTSDRQRTNCREEWIECTMSFRMEATSGDKYYRIRGLDGLVNLVLTRTDKFE